MAASDTTLAGTYISQHDAETARLRLEKRGIEPVTIEEAGKDVWKVHVPAERRDDAIEQLSILEQRRRGPAV